MSRSRSALEVIKPSGESLGRVSDALGLRQRRAPAGTLANGVDKTGQLVGQDHDWSEGVSALKMPTLIVVGDADSVRTAHAVQFFELLGGGKRDAGWNGSGMSDARLAILPGITHYNITKTFGSGASCLATSLTEKCWESCVHFVRATRPN